MMHFAISDHKQTTPGRRLVGAPRVTGSSLLVITASPDIAHLQGEKRLGPVNSFPGFIERLTRRPVAATPEGGVGSIGKTLRVKPDTDVKRVVDST